MTPANKFLLFWVLEIKAMKMSNKKDADRAQVVCRISLCLSFNWHKPCQDVPGMLANCEALVEILKHSTGSQST